VASETCLELLMVAGVHYFHYAHVVFTFVQVNMKYGKNSVKFYVLKL